MNLEVQPAHSIQIKEAKMQDSAAIAGMWYQSYVLHNRLDPGYYHEPNKDLEDYIKATLEEIFTKQNKKVYIATDNDAAVGFLISSVSETNPSTGIIEEVYRDEKYRGERIGKQLMDKAEDDFRLQKITRSQLQYAATNTPAETFYSKLEYTPHQAILYKELDAITSPPTTDVAEATAEDIETLKQSAPDPTVFEGLVGKKSGKVFVTRNDQQKPVGFLICYQGEPEYDSRITNYGVIEAVSAPDEETKAHLLQNAEKHFLQHNFTHSKFEIPHNEGMIDKYSKLGYFKRQVVVANNLSTNLPK